MLHKKYLLLLMLGLLSVNMVFAQWKSYKIGAKGDTLNRVDMNNLKQGQWLIEQPPLRGEPGYLETGIYINDKKEGAWSTYTLIGDILSNENYKWGLKNGLSTFYNSMGVERIESWRAFNPANAYDTIDVPDLHSDTVYKRIIKSEPESAKHGTWSFYNAATGALIKTEEWILNQMVDIKKEVAYYKSSTMVAEKPKYIKSDSASLKKPPEVQVYEKKNSGKKKVRVRDGATGG